MFPKLVRNPKTPVRVVIHQEDVDEFGERPVILDKFFMCNYQESGTVKYTKDKQHPEVNGTIYIDGDVLDSLEILNSDFSITEDGTLVLATDLDENGTLIRSNSGEFKSGVAVCGYVAIFGRKRQIVRGTKARNLDGTVNYTRLDVI